MSPTPRGRSCGASTAESYARGLFARHRAIDSASMCPAPLFTSPDAVLQSIFGYSEFRPGQRRIIDAVLAGRDCIGLMPTGAGKSLTFQIPAKLLPGAVLVISPLISLMKDQVDGLQTLGF